MELLGSINEQLSKISYTNIKSIIIYDCHDDKSSYQRDFDVL